MKHTLSVILLILISVCCHAQHGHDDTHEHGGIHFIADTTDFDEETETRYRINLKKPNAGRSVWLGAIVPGLGQIYNGSYWKLPIVYGGYMGCGYAIARMNIQYTDYKQAYRDLYTDNQKGLVDPNDPDKSYNKVLPAGYTIDRMGGTGNYIQTLQRNQNNYRRYRDISIVAALVIYGLSLVDAYVDAQLFDFDISPDLSLEVEPQIYYDLHNNKAAELHVAFRF